MQFHSLSHLNLQNTSVFLINPVENPSITYPVQYIRMLNIKVFSFCSQKSVSSAVHMN